MRGRLALAAVALALTAGCAPSRREEPPPPAVPKPNIDPARTPRPPVRVPEPEPPLERVAPPEVAAARGWMPLASTGVERLRREHATWDGRGVLIAILDTGVDPSIPGLATTSTGDPKLVDVRDFSGEGAVDLRRVEPAGDSVRVGPRVLGGFGRARALGGAGPYYAGTIEERRLGGSVAADLDGDGSPTDTLALVVVRASDGWVLLADRDGDGSLDGEQPVRDFRRGREWFGWAAPGRAPAVGIAATVEEAGGLPRLTLVFDLDAHGSHVAGIAAGHEIYGAPGLSGAAPGAQLLGLKISRSAQGMISTTGAMLAALDYAIRTAAARRQPLVVNISFGVGNEREGAAEIDRLVDSVLRRHPEVVLVASAGNDGPGLSTVGFPGSASRALTVGATLPPAFLAVAEGRPAADAVAPFSARGGELAKPDLLAPGVAYSSVPRWNAGDEVKQGTSMAAPQISGLAALMLSALAQSGRRVDATTLRRALMLTALPVAGASLVEGGRGLPDPEAAMRWLLADRRPQAELSARAAVDHGNGALLVQGGAAPAGATAEFVVRREGGAPGEYTLRADVPWLHPPTRVAVADSARVRVRYGAGSLSAPGAHSGVVTGWGRDTLEGPAFRLPVTIVRPAGLAEGPVALRTDEPVPAGGTLRSFFEADSARPFEVRVSGGAGATALAFLHEPGGRPFRGGHAAPLAGGRPATFAVGAEESVRGAYEVVVSALPARDLTATVEVRHSPLSMRLARSAGQVVTAELANRTSAPISATVEVALVGTELTRSVREPGQAPHRLPLTIPGWANEARIEVSMDPAAWGRYTDFGVTLVDSAGVTLGTQPLNYASGHLVVPLPGGADRAAELVLFPGFAAAADTSGWRAQVAVRFLAPAETPLRPRGGDTSPVTLAAGASVTRAFELPPIPGRAGDEHPLAVLTVLVDGHRWSRKAGVPITAVKASR